MESPNFVVYDQTGLDDARKLVDELEVFRAVLMHASSTPRQNPAEVTPRKLTVIITDGESSLSSLFGVAGMAAGFYTVSYDAPLMVSSFENSARTNEARAILFHEYAHHFMLQYYPGFYPAWYVEGFAEFYSNTEITDEHVTIGGVSDFRAPELNQTWIPMQQLISGSVWDQSSSDIYRFYAQAWLFVHYLTFTPERQQALVTYINALRRGEDAITAFEPAFGVTPEAMQASLRSYTRVRLPMMRYQRTQLGERPHVDVNRLPKFADRLFIPSQRLRWGRTSTDLAKQLLRELPERSNGAPPDDPWVWRYKAWAMVRAGNYDDATRLVDQALAANPEDFEALRLRLEMAWLRYSATPNGAETDREAGLAAASAVLERDPRQPFALFVLGELGDKSSEAGLAERLSRLRQARQALPQHTTYAMAYGAELLDQQRIPEGRRVLQRLAANPHGGLVARRAQWMIDKVDGRPVGPDPAEEARASRN